MKQDTYDIQNSDVTAHKHPDKREETDRLSELDNLLIKLEDTNSSEYANMMVSNSIENICKKEAIYPSDIPSAFVTGKPSIYIRDSILKQYPLKAKERWLYTGGCKNPCNSLGGPCEFDVELVPKQSRFFARRAAGSNFFRQELLKHRKQGQKFSGKNDCKLWDPTANEREFVNKYGIRDTVATDLVYYELGDLPPVSLIPPIGKGNYFKSEYETPATFDTFGSFKTPPILPINDDTDQWFDDGQEQKTSDLVKCECPTPPSYLPQQSSDSLISSPKIKREKLFSPPQKDESPVNNKMEEEKYYKERQRRKPELRRLKERQQLQNKNETKPPVPQDQTEVTQCHESRQENTNKRSRYELKYELSNNLNTQLNRNYSCNTGVPEFEGHQQEVNSGSNDIELGCEYSSPSASDVNSQQQSLDDNRYVYDKGESQCSQPLLNNDQEYNGQTKYQQDMQRFDEEFNQRFTKHPRLENRPEYGQEYHKTESEEEEEDEDDGPTMDDILSLLRDTSNSQPESPTQSLMPSCSLNPPLLPLPVPALPLASLPVPPFRRPQETMIFTKKKRKRKTSGIFVNGRELNRRQATKLRRKAKKLKRQLRANIQ